MTRKLSLVSITSVIALLVGAALASANDGFYPVPQVTYYYPDTAYYPQTPYYGAPTTTYYGGVTPTTTFAEPGVQSASPSPQQPTPARDNGSPASSESASQPAAPAANATSQTPPPGYV